MPSVRGKRVLIFGDSLSADPSSPGAELGRSLVATGATVKIDAVVGRSANSFWARADAGDHLADICAFAPQVAIIELGTNDIGLSMAVDGARMAQLRDAISSCAPGVEIWGLGPPAFAATSGLGISSPAVVEMMLDVFGHRFIDLRPLTSDMVIAGQGGRAADGVHFTAAGGQVVGRRIADEFQRADSMPIGTMLIALVLGTLAWAIVR